ncbi:hypothetical protein R9Y00_000068 [Vibrio cholerae]|nr:hypothetical protein [Vibrio cholerae]
MAEVFGSEGMKNLHLRGALVLTGPEAEAAVLAVKNHDRLVEENKKLHEALEKSQRLMNAFGMIMVDVKRPKEDTINKLNRLISVHMDDLFSSNKKLLSEISGEKDAQLK